MTVQPGWYADPAEPTTQRYWDGDGWIGAPLPVDATPPPGPPPVEPEPVTPPESPAAGPTSAAPAEPHAPGLPGQPLPPGAGAPGPGFPLPGQPFPPGQPPQGAPGAYPPGWTYPPGTPPTANGMPGNYPPGMTPPPGWPYPVPFLYRPPAPRPHGYALASLGARLVARLIDIGMVFLLNVVVNGFFVWRYIQEMAPVFRESFQRGMTGNSSTEGLPQPGDQAGSLQIAILLVATALWFAYEVPAVANRGQTLGKRIMGIKVVSLGKEERLGFGQSLRRWNTLGLPTLLWFCCFGFLLQLIDVVFPLFDRPLRQALHDKRAETVVVQVSRQSPTPAGEPTETPGGPE